MVLDSVPNYVKMTYGEINFGLNGRVGATHPLYHILLEKLSVRTISKSGILWVKGGYGGTPC